MTGSCFRMCFGQPPRRSPSLGHVTPLFARWKKWQFDNMSVPGFPPVMSFYLLQGDTGVAFTYGCTLFPSDLSFQLSQGESFPSVTSFDMLYLLQKGGSLPSVISLTLSELIPPSSCKGQKELVLTHVCICFPPVTSCHVSQDARSESYHMSVLGFPSVISFVLFAICLNYVCTCSSSVLSFLICVYLRTIYSDSRSISCVAHL